MQLLPQIQIKAKSDTCTVQRFEWGKIHVGSIALDSDEIDGFCDALKAAVRMITPTTEKAEQ